MDDDDQSRRHGPGHDRDQESQEVTVLLVDDHQMVARSLAAVIEDDPGLTVAGVAATAAEAVAAVGRLHPQVVVMDYHLPDASGAEATRRVLALDPDTNVVMLTASSDDAVLREALQAGCCGFVAKDTTIEELTRAVRAAAEGGGVFPPALMARLARPATQRPDHPPLTEREGEVLHLVAAGASTGAIAVQLGLSQHTVRNHVRNVLTKLGAHSKLEAVVIASGTGLIDLPHQP